MENKKIKISAIISLIAIVVLVAGATYAYFQNQYGSASNADVKVMTYTTDVLTFETGDAINISADQETFAEGKGNQTGSTFARATLQANNKTNTATANYYVYLNIENNTFTYTNAGTPELILQVIDKDSGNPVTSITGLDYVTVTDGKNTSISGFDITDKSGLIALFLNKEISASPKTVEEYTVTITLVNHDFDQNNNTGKNLNGKLIIQKGELSLADYVISRYTGIQGENGIYYHDSNLTNGAEDNSYRFAGSNPDNYVCFGSDEATCPHENLYRMIGLIDGKIKLISADYATTDILGTDGGYEETYQETGWSISNYKGSVNTSKIGVYRWNASRDNNTWSDSTTNLTNLNKNYLAYLDAKDSKWQKMIDDTTWYVGGLTGDNGQKTNAKTAYNYEVGVNKDVSTTYQAKIGLMYVSDYYYGASAEYWVLPGIDSSKNDYRKTYNDNWINLGMLEWTLSRIIDSSDDNKSSFFIDGEGYVVKSVVTVDTPLRPTFNLSSSVKYVSGDGSIDSPIRLSL